MQALEDKRLDASKLAERLLHAVSEEPTRAELAEVAHLVETIQYEPAKEKLRVIQARLAAAKGA